jgi:predicted NAD-dependent protein-ADP-ribosyltransferase YbiA (DUF1768 family)
MKIMSFYSIAPFIKEFYPEYYSIESYPAKDCVKIHKVSEEWGVLSNFAKTPLVVNGVTFDSAEELFQMMKFKNKEVLMNIMNRVTNNAKICHLIKKTVKSYEKDYRREDWGEMIVDAIKFCLQTKDDQSNEFREVLEKSNGKFIVEDQTSFPKKTPDTWGVKLQGDYFIGPSLLGRLLMELRDNGKLEYKLPKDALDFVEHLK